MDRPSPPPALTRDLRGTALVEFAIALPMLLCLLFGMVNYGQYFLLAHDAQQIANDAARATIAGINAAEREQLAKKHVAADLAALSLIDPAMVGIAVREGDETVTVTIRIDASDLALVGRSLLPMPDPVIERRAVIAPGGVI